MAGFNLFVFGEQYQFNDVSLNTRGKEYAFESLRLQHSGQVPQDERLNLDLTAGFPAAKNSLNLHIINYVSFSFTTPENLSLNLFTISSDNVLTREDNPFLDLYINVNDAPVFSDSIYCYLKVDEPIESISSGLMLSLWNEDFAVLSTITDSMNLLVASTIYSTSLSDHLSLYITSYLDVVAYSASVNLFLAQDNKIVWDSDNPGLNTIADDDVYASVSATDAIRGVSLICYGNCENGTCEDVSIETHDTVWFEPLCVDGGIFRANDVYTNLSVGAFGSDVPYSGHFYGIRKLTGLIPAQQYSISIIGDSGSSVKIPAPKELANWSYTVDGSQVAYSGTKLIGDDPYVDGGRNAGDRYGSSVSIFQDLMAIGSPHFSVIDSENYTMVDTGTVFLYRREEQPTPDNIVDGKAEWLFEASLSLPSGILRDYYVDTPSQQDDGINIIERKWFLGQEGRNFGSSLDTCIINNDDPWILSDTRELIAVGAPNAVWSRTFPDLSVRKNEILLFVFTDEFLPTVGNLTYRDILDSIDAKNLLYTYYSQPTISLSIKIVIFQPIDFDIQENLDFLPPKPSFIIKKAITRHRNEILNSQEYNDVDDELYNQIKDTFEELYPPSSSTIPAILGVYVDNSRSLGNAAVEPALTRFKDYYQSYSFNNGLKLYDDITPTSGAVLSTTSLDENWILQTKTLLDFALDSGRLAKQDYLSLLTDPSSFGQFNLNLPEYNYPPSSGGCVYIFEKESGSWNMIQQIDSPNNDNSIPPDLFGKSVDLSKDGNILVVGSPYIDQAVTIYERDIYEQNKLYSNIESWIDYHLEKDQYDPFYGQLKFNITSMRELDEYKENDSGIFRNIFLNLSHQEKYEYRNDANYWVEELGGSTVQEYKEIFTYKYSDISYVGSYKSIVDQFAPTSRMGYSVAVDDSGDSVAIGCPTDSLDEFDDTNTYYHPTNSGQILWPSYVNAGAVRIFDSVKFFPHNSVVEYSKFGNQDIVAYGAETPEAFEHFGDVFGEIGKTFSRTSFDDYEIPQNAGVLMIICPAVDFSNIEVMNRIKAWLDLGDRNLVLVSNDIVNEKIPVFRKCNTIINNILSKLDSSMRLASVPSRTSSLLNSDGSCFSRPNVIASYKPDNSIDSYVANDEPLFGRGASDIRIYAPEINEQYTCSEVYRNNNDHCSPPLVNSGDLRAEWTDEAGLRNWPALFEETYGGNKLAPIPLMTSAYYKDPIVVDIPPKPAVSGLYTYFDYVESDVSPEFGKIKNSDPQFVFSDTDDDYIAFNRNVTLNSNINRFFNPAYKMTVDAALQCKASNGLDIVQGEKEVSNPCYFSAQENIPNTNNTVYLVGSLFPESKEVLYSGLGDNNINFYFNLVATNALGSSYIAQLNSFSGRSDFKDANPDSILELIFRNTGNFVSTNVSLSQLISGHPSGERYNVCWIANPINMPTDNDIVQLKKWLSRGNKKIIVTYDNDGSAKSAEILCSLLNITMKPLYLPTKGRYAISKTDCSFDDRLFYGGSTVRSPRYITINPLNRQMRYGFTPSRDSIENITVNVKITSFTPLELNNATPIASIDHGISDDALIDVGFYYMQTGTARISAEVQPNTAYRIFFKTAAFSDYENEPLTAYITNCSSAPSFGSPPVPPDQSIFNLENDGTFSEVFNGPVGVIEQFNNTKNRLIQERYFDIHTLDGVNEISIYINGDNSRIEEDYDSRPSTVALISVSGALINIDAKPVLRKVPRYDWRIIHEAEPGYTKTIEFPDPFPIQSDSLKYCPGNQDFFSLDDCSNVFQNSLVEDGPVIVAQEIYNSNVTNRGINKSRITLISDSSLIEGACIFDENGDIRNSHSNFIKSLYPDTEFPENNGSKLFRSNNAVKIVCQERNSPARLFSGIGDSGIIRKFIPDNNLPAESGTLMSDFRDTVDYASVDRPDLLNSDLSSVTNSFKISQNTYGANSKFKMDIGGALYSDVNVGGGKPSIIDAYGADFIDYDVFASGYPGDLFGYSLDFYRGRLVIGAPFATYSGEYILNWNSVANETDQYNAPAGTVVSQNGGAGSVYIYEKTNAGYTLSQENIPWQFIQKLRPRSIGVGQDLDSVAAASGVAFLGNHKYSADDLVKYSTFTDQFGHSVKIHGDIIAVGTPGHDYSINADLADSILASGAYEFKSFNFEFDAKPRTLIDLGDPDVRDAIGLISGVMNNGAVYTYEYKVINSRTKAQSWVLVEKLIPDGYKSRLQQNYDEVLQVIVSGSENEHFGENLAIYRTKRTDADYTIAIGAPHHKFATSSSHISGDLEDAGAVYLFDAMLREQPPYLPDSGAYIHANVFGMPHRKVSMYVDNTTLNNRYYNVGIITSNTEGEIFVEASGQDANLLGFSVHRPYIKAVYGRVYSEGADSLDSNLILFTNAISGSETINMPLLCNAANKSNVYNNMTLFMDTYGIIDGSQMNLYAHTPSGTSFGGGDDWLGLYCASGIANQSNTLNFITWGY